MATLQLLLENGAEINVQSNYGTVLHIASRVGHINIIQYLLQNGAQLEAKDGHQQKILHYAAKRCDSATVQMLPNIEIQRKSESALNFTSDRGDANGLPVLLEAMDDMGRTALTAAVLEGNHLQSACC